MLDIDAKIAALQEKKREQRTHGSRLFGRFFRAELAPEEHFRLRMATAKRDTLSKWRDRRLHDLPTETCSRRLRSEVLAADVRAMECKREEIDVELVSLRRALKAEQRRDEDARLIHEGEIVRRWCEADPKVRALVEQKLPPRLKQEKDFEAVGLPVPDGLTASTPSVPGSGDKGAVRNEGESAARPAPPVPAAVAPSLARPSKAAVSAASVSKPSHAAVAGGPRGGGSGRGHAPRATATGPAGSKSARARQAAAAEGGK